jgi:hypothetical protein
MHRSGRSAALNFRNHFGGHSVMVAVRAICPSPFFSSAALRRRKKTDPQHGPCSCQSWPRRHEADGGQEELDGCSHRSGHLAPTWQQTIRVHGP